MVGVGLEEEQGLTTLTTESLRFWGEENERQAQRIQRAQTIFSRATLETYLNLLGSYYENRSRIGSGLMVEIGSGLSDGGRAYEQKFSLSHYGPRGLLRPTYKKSPQDHQAKLALFSEPCWWAASYQEAVAKLDAWIAGEPFRDAEARRRQANPPPVKRVLWEDLEEPDLPLSGAGNAIGGNQ